MAVLVIVFAVNILKVLEIEQAEQHKRWTRFD